jgi:hypothetical protein
MWWQPMGTGLIVDLEQMNYVEDDRVAASAARRT